MPTGVDRLENDKGIEKVLDFQAKSRNSMY